MKRKPVTLLKVTLLHGCFSRFLNCTYGTKLHKASQMQLEVLCNPLNEVYQIKTKEIFQIKFGFCLSQFARSMHKPNYVRIFKTELLRKLLPSFPTITTNIP